ncbi:sigma-70 family RNA polymerase sigma factor [Candidatus Sumerlaeota bacterium]
MATVGTKQSDEQLALAALGGDVAAFERLVEEYFGTVYAIAYARLRHHESAEDLTQEVFLRAFLYLEQLEQPRLFAAWLGRIARHLAYQWQRQGHRRWELAPTLSLGDEISWIPDTQAEGARGKMAAKEQSQAIHQAIAGLPPEQAELVLLRFGQELGVAEIARRLGIHTGTVRRRLKKALAAMKDSLEPILHESLAPLQPSRKAVSGALALIVAAGALAPAAKAAALEAAGGAAWLAAVPPAAAGGAGLLSVTTTIATGGKFMLTTKGIAALAIVAGLGVGTAIMNQSPDGPPPNSTVGGTAAAPGGAASIPVGSSGGDRSRALRLLEQAKPGEMAGVDDLIRALDDKDPIMRQAAAAALRTITEKMFTADAKRWRDWWQSIKQPAESTAELLERLDDPRDEARRETFWKLAHKDDEQAAAALFERWVNRKNGHPSGEPIYAERDVYRRDEKFLRGAVALLGDQMIEALIPLADCGWGISEDARQLLAGCDSAKVEAAVARGLTSDDSFRRSGAIKLAESHRSLAAVPALIQTLEKSNQGPALAAFKSLVQYDKQAIPLYQQAFANGSLNVYARGAVAILLANLGDRSGWGMLEAIVARSPAHEMNTIIGHAGETHNRLFWPLIEKALQRPDSEQSLTYVARFCGGISAIPALERIAKEHPDKGTRYGAEIQLGVLRKEMEESKVSSKEEQREERLKQNRERELEQLRELARWEESERAPAGDRP